MTADFPYEREVDARAEQAYRARAQPSRPPAPARRPGPRATVDAAIARARDAVDHPLPEDPLETRKAAIRAELKANDERQVTPFQTDGVRVWCEAMRPDGVRVAVIGRVGTDASRGQ